MARQSEWRLSVAVLIVIAGGIVAVIAIMMGVAGVEIHDPNVRATKVDCGSAWSPNYDAQGNVFASNAVSFDDLCQTRIQNRLHESLGLLVVGTIILAAGLNAALSPDPTRTASHTP